MFCRAQVLGHWVSDESGWILVEDQRCNVHVEGRSQRGQWPSSRRLPHSPKPPLWHLYIMTTLPQNFETHEYQLEV